MTCDRSRTEMVGAMVFRGGRSGAASGGVLLALSTLLDFGLFTGVAVPPDGNLAPSHLLGAACVLVGLPGVRAVRTKAVWRCGQCGALENAG